MVESCLPQGKSACSKLESASGLVGHLEALQALGRAPHIKSVITYCPNACKPAPTSIVCAQWVSRPGSGENPDHETSTFSISTSTWGSKDAASLRQPKFQSSKSWSQRKGSHLTPEPTLNCVFRIRGKYYPSILDSPCSSLPPNFSWAYGILDYFF